MKEIQYWKSNWKKNGWIDFVHSTNRLLQQQGEQSSIDNAGLSGKTPFLLVLTLPIWPQYKPFLALFQNSSIFIPIFRVNVAAPVKQCHCREWNKMNFQNQSISIGRNDDNWLLFWKIFPISMPFGVWWSQARGFGQASFSDTYTQASIQFWISRGSVIADNCSPITFYYDRAKRKFWFWIYHLGGFRSVVTKKVAMLSLIFKQREQRTLFKYSHKSLKHWANESRIKWGDKFSLPLWPSTTISDGLLQSWWWSSRNFTHPRHIHNIIHRHSWNKSETLCFKCLFIEEAIK